MRLTITEEIEPIPFDITAYTHEQQMAMLTMRFNDPLAKAVLMRLHSSTVAGKDFAGLKQLGLAVWNGARQLHDFTPRGRWVSQKVTEHLAKTFEVVVVRPPRLWSESEKRRYAISKYNWANR
ncbi:MAG: hypothetical protein C4523_00040 [Myxococcales bacterium]|nr:MAG: hypothetical protein C4523_00040 [Myxococcales bacterium]